MHIQSDKFKSIRKEEGKLIGSLNLNCQRIRDRTEETCVEICKEFLFIPFSFPVLFKKIQMCHDALISI